MAADSTNTSMFFPLAPLHVYRGILMYAGGFDQDDSWNFVRFSSDLVEERDYFITRCRLLRRSPDQQAIRDTQAGSHAADEQAAAWFGDFPSSVLHRRSQTET